ncbi:MAG: PQQ-binding-like beta-propeller repeat protein [Phycisphaerales bacterium]|nr:PQQ-binding-like beta-propeller repeat protein [Phycisphaerales bacterium]
MADAWSTYQHDAQHTGRSPVSFNPQDLNYSWSAPDGYSLPLVVGSKVYSMRYGVGEQTRVASFDLSDGSVNWEYSQSYFSPSAPTYGEGLIVYSAENRDSEDGLYVHDAATGALKYTVPLSNHTNNMPTLHRNPTTNKLVAYVATNRDIQAIELGDTSGAVIWTGSGNMGGDSIPTIIGDSVVVAGPNHYYAFDMTTGTPNEFQSGSGSGGGGATVAYDEARGQFYVSELYSGISGGLTAYAYTDNSTISQIWQKTNDDPGIDARMDVAIDEDGYIYSSDNTRLVKLDPATGDEVDFVTGSFANGMAPMVSDGYVWTFSSSQTRVYDTDTLTLVDTFSGSRGNSSSAFRSPGALTDAHFLLTYGQVNDSGFDVYAIPEPTMLSLLTLGTAVLMYRRNGRVVSG